MVWQPLNEIGKYGGTWRRAFTGPGDVENGNRINASDKCFFWSADGGKIVPCVAKAYELSDDGKTYTMHLRKGMKWSDGAPFTADDFVFWFEDIYSNREIVPTPIPDMTAHAASPAASSRVDETTVRFEFDVPYYLFEEMMAGDTQIGGGQSVRQSQKTQLRRLFARPLPEAVPAEIFVGRSGQRARQAGGLRELGADAALQEGLVAQHRTADAGSVEDGAVDQQPGLAAGAQSVLLRR